MLIYLHASRGKQTTKILHKISTYTIHTHLTASVQILWQFDIQGLFKDLSMTSNNLDLQRLSSTLLVLVQSTSANNIMQLLYLHPQLLSKEPEARKFSTSYSRN